MSRVLRNLYPEKSDWTVEEKDDDSVTTLQRVDIESVSDREVNAPPLPTTLKQEILTELRREIISRQQQASAGANALASLAHVVAGTISPSLLVTNKRNHTDGLVGEPKRTKSQMLRELIQFSEKTTNRRLQIQVLEEEQEELKEEIRRLTMIVDSYKHDADALDEGGEVDAWPDPEPDPMPTPRQKTSRTRVAHVMDEVDVVPMRGKGGKTKRAPARRKALEDEFLSDDDDEDIGMNWEEMDKEWGEELASSKGGRASLKSSATKTKAAPKRATGGAKKSTKIPTSPSTMTRTRSGTIQRQSVTDLLKDPEEPKPRRKSTSQRGKKSSEDKQEDHEATAAIEPQGAGTEALLHAQLLESLRDIPLTFGAQETQPQSPPPTQPQNPIPVSDRAQQFKAELLAQLDQQDMSILTNPLHLLTQAQIQQQKTPTQAQQQQFQTMQAQAQAHAAAQAQALRAQVTAQALQAQAHAKALQAQVQAQALQAQAHVQALQAQAMGQSISGLMSVPPATSAVVMAQAVDTDSK